MQAGQDQVGLPISRAADLTKRAVIWPAASCRRIPAPARSVDILLDIQLKPAAGKIGRPGSGQGNHT